jgi:5-formyltetrahydrofolate cyclo-ligase
LAVPYCLSSHLELRQLLNWNELRPGRFSILEPAPEWRLDRSRRVDPAEVDVFVVPGIGFTKDGQRLGNGLGFYDRLLARAPQATRIGLAYSVQIVDAIPAEPHDIRMHTVITEDADTTVP